MRMGTKESCPGAGRRRSRSYCDRQLRSSRSLVRRGRVQREISRHGQLREALMASPDLSDRESGSGILTIAAGSITDPKQ